MREKRETLTGMLMALMEQKEARQAELSDRLTELEKHKSEETDNYWLIQYQKLLDSKPKVLLRKLCFIQVGIRLKVGTYEHTFILNQSALKLFWLR